MNLGNPPAAILHDQIELWSADLDANDPSVQSAYALLSLDERERARRFRFSLDRSRYIARRGILRILLGRYLNAAPEAISFSYGRNGKPALSNEALHFNLSHTHGLAYFAFSAASPVGIDVERIRPLPDLLNVAIGFCSPAELAHLKSLPAEQQTTAFFRCWTRKEAYVKALGRGLSHPLDQICVSSGEPARLLDGKRYHAELRGWHFHGWYPREGYLGAVVSQLATVRVVQYRFPHALERGLLHEWRK